MANNGRLGAPLLSPLHTTVTQYVGILSVVAAPGVRHHGGREMMAAAMVGGWMV